MSKVVVSISCRPFFIQKIFIGNALCPCIILSAMVNMELSKLYFYSNKVTTIVEEAV